MRQRILTVWLLLCTITVAARAQSDVATMMPWNGYDSVQVIAGNFVSIVPTGTRIEGSQSAGPDGKVFTLSFNDFPIGFLQQVYAVPVAMKVSTHGWVSFNGSAGTSSAPIPQLWYTTSTARPYDNKVLMAYWCNLRTDDVTNGGIYWKSTSVNVTVDGVTDSRRCLIIEWVARANHTGTTASRFQVRLFERTGLGLNSMIEWHFAGPSIDLPQATASEFNYGAQVGVKNFGNIGGNPAITGDPAGLDREKMLIIGHPNQLPGLDRRGITRLRTMEVPNDLDVMTPYKPEWWAYYSRYYVPVGIQWSSPYFHYSFPSGGGPQRPAYRMKPVIIDMGASAITLNGLDASVPNSVDAGSEVAPLLGFKNLGAYSARLVPFTLDIYRILISGVDPNPVEHYSGIIDSIAGGGQDLRLPGYDKRGYFIQTPGLYKIVVRVSQQGDRNPYNDTISGLFIVRGTVDLLPREVVAPRPNTAPDFTTYRVGEAIPFVARYINTGYQAVRNVTVGYTVLDSRLDRVDSGSATISSIGAADSATQLFTTQWVPNKPGRYYFRTYIVGQPDATPQDDSLPAAPNPGIPFDVYYDIDAAVSGGQGNEPFAPSPGGGTRGVELPLMATVLNNGPALLRSIPVHISVTDASGAEVFTKTETVTDVPSGGSAQVTVNGFTPGSAGQHCVTVSIAVAGDVVRGNDTAHWCFTVATAGAVETSNTVGRLAVAAMPNPASTHAIVTYRAAEGEMLHIVLTDMLGNEVWRSPDARAHANDRFELPTSALPAGVYFVQLRTASGTATTKLTVTR